MLPDFDITQHRYLLITPYPRLLSVYARGRAIPDRHDRQLRLRLPHSNFTISQRVTKRPKAYHRGRRNSRTAASCPSSRSSNRDADSTFPIGFASLVLSWPFPFMSPQRDVQLTAIADAIPAPPYITTDGFWPVHLASLFIAQTFS